VKNVQEEDRGQYMCQINTDPMISQVIVFSEQILVAIDDTLSLVLLLNLFRTILFKNFFDTFYRPHHSSATAKTIFINV